MGRAPYKYDPERKEFVVEPASGGHAACVPVSVVGGGHRPAGPGARRLRVVWLVCAGLGVIWLFMVLVWMLSTPAKVLPRRLPGFTAPWKAGEQDNPPMME